MNVDKIMPALINLTLILSLAFLVLLTYYRYVDGNGLANFPSEPISTDQLVYQSGDHVLANISYCQRKPFEAATTCGIVDGAAIYSPQFSISLPTGCNSYMLRLIKIPAFVQKGQYYVECSSTYEVNSLKKLRYSYRTTFFNVSGE